MRNEDLEAIWQEGVKLMADGHTCAEATLRVLQSSAACSPLYCQWAAAGYMGAISTGKTLCGTLFGGTVFLGCLHGRPGTQAPEIDDERRSRAVESVHRLFDGFLERFGDTDCHALTGCDWSNEENVARYYAQEVYKAKCFRYFEYVVAECLDEMMVVA